MSIAKGDVMEILGDRRCDGPREEGHEDSGKHRAKDPVLGEDLR